MSKDIVSPPRNELGSLVRPPSIIISGDRRNVRQGDEIVITWLEHHANIVPWQMLCSEIAARLRVAPVDDRGQIILEEYEKLLNPKTRIFAISRLKLCRRLRLGRPGMVGDLVARRERQNRSEEIRVAFTINDGLLRGHWSGNAQLVDDNATDKVLRDNLVEILRSASAVPDALWIDDRNRPVRTGSEAIGLGALDAASLAQAELLQPFLQMVP